MPFYISRFNGMEQRKLEVEVITPLFLGGSDPKKAELRVPSIKGALRFWWRAINPHLSLKDLSQQESELFGDAGEEYGKSKVKIKFDKILYYNGKDKENPVPHKKVPFKFPCFMPGGKFSLKIYGNQKMIDLFKLLAIVGGIGKRSRRGFGSFSISRIDGETYKTKSSIDEILTLIQNVSDNKFRIDNDKIIRSDNVHADYAYIKTIEIGNGPFSNYKPLLEKIGQSSHDNNSDFTGYAKGKERFASPIYVSIVNYPEGYKPIVSTLNASFKSKNQHHGQDKSVQFKKDILSGGSK